jgi:hypothetical protein
MKLMSSIFRIKLSSFLNNMNISPGSNKMTNKKSTTTTAINKQTKIAQCQNISNIGNKNCRKLQNRYH